MSNEARYYLILEHIVGMRKNGIYYLYEDGEWRVDERCMIMDRLMGYDPSEPPGSPFGIGNDSIMDEIEDITYEEAMELIGENV